MSRRVLRGFDRHEFKRLRLAWRGTGITPQDLGRLSRVGVSTIWKWEQGQRSPNIDKLAPVLDILDIPTDAVIRIPAGERHLSDLRNLARLTQPQLAKAAGMSTTVLSMLEHGTTPMTDAKAAALAPLLGASCEGGLAGGDIRRYHRPAARDSISSDFDRPRMRGVVARATSFGNSARRAGAWAERSAREAVGIPTPPWG